MKPPKDSLMCDLSKKLKRVHLLKQPQNLPCNRSVCLDCLELEQPCPFCQIRHRKVDVFCNRLIQNEIEDSTII
jgi:hypothetical protein